MDSSCNIWEVNTGKLVNKIELSTPLRCLAVSEGDQFLCLCSLPFAGKEVFLMWTVLLQAVIYIYDLRNGMESIKDPMMVIEGVCSSQPCKITSVIWSPLNKEIIAGQVSYRGCDEQLR